MSGKAMEAAIKLHEELTHNELWVLVALAYHQNWSTGKCNPSHETIAAYAKCSISTVKRTLTRLRERGIVDWKGHNRGIKGALNHYTMHLNSSSPSELVIELPSPASKLKSGRLEAQNAVISSSPSELGTRTEQGNKVSDRQTAEVDMEKVKKLVEAWNSLPGVKKYHPTKKALRGDFERNTFIAVLVDFVSGDWEEEWEHVLEEYRNSKFLQSGGSAGINSLTWLFKNGSANMEKVLAGTYRDPAPKPQPTLVKPKGKTEAEYEEERQAILERSRKAGWKV